LYRFFLERVLVLSNNPRKLMIWKYGPRNPEHFVVTGDFATHHGSIKVDILHEIQAIFPRDPSPSMP
jgi:hypothetical protein